MTDYPIIMSGPMVRALLEGRKTQDRRLAWTKVKLINIHSVRPPYPTIWQKVRPGDRLWVKENWRTLHKWDCLAPRHMAPDIHKVTFDADPERRNPLWAFGKLRPSIHMPRWASRLTLTVTEARIQRLEDIDWDDAIAEGVVDTGRRDGEPWNHCEVPDVMPPIREACARACYLQLWDSLHGDDNLNPEVVAMTFTVALENIGPKEVAA